MAEPERKTVLVIDDDKMVQRYAEEFFKRLKFNFHAASDGYEGLKLALSSKPDIIFLEYHDAASRRLQDAPGHQIQ